MKKLHSAISAVALGALLATPALSSLTPKVTFSGNLRLSVDAAGSNTGTANIRVQKPTVNSTVRAAYLLAASTGFTGYAIAPGDIRLDGVSISFTDTVANSISSHNYWTAVDQNIRPKLNAAPAGIVNFTVNELPSITGSIDGVILAVVWDEPSAPQTTVTLMFGAQSTAGDAFSVTLAQPVDKTNPATVLDMSLGISYGYQPSGQYSLLELGVNGTRISTSAGGQDDGAPENGALITAGGIGDLNDNPPNALATDGNCASSSGAPAPRCDDELYNLLPFVANGATSFTVSSRNPSNDDNIFFAAIVLGANTAAVGEGILASPATASAPVGGNQSVNARVQASNGTGIVGRQVTFRVISGPNVGLTGIVPTDGTGNALFTYSSTLAGSDTVQACMTNSSSVIQCSNQVVRTWTGTSSVTFTFLLEPTGWANPVNSSHTVTARILNSSGQPVAGKQITFTVISGPNSGLTLLETTNASGIASVSYSSALPGTDVIRATANLGGVNQNSNTVTKLWLAATGNPVLTLSPATATNPVNGQHKLTATAFTPSGAVVPGVTVTFNVLSGPNLGSLGTASTNSSGNATKSYISTTSGTDTIQASATINGISTLSAIVSKTWSGLLCDVDNNGQIDNRDITLVFQARNTLVGPGDTRDANFDGRIDALDLTGCRLRCTKPQCAQ